MVLTSSNGETLKYVIQLGFWATNNMAEYKGLLAGLRATVGLEYQCADPQMATYVAEVWWMEWHFDGLEV